MSYNDTLLVQCENLQQKLRDGWMSLQPVRPIPFLEYVASPENTKNIKTMVNPGGGKVRNVSLTYHPPIPISDVTSQSGRNCEVDAKYGNNVATYEIDTEDVIATGERITASDLERVCVDNGTYIADRILAHLAAIDQKIAQNIAAEAALLVGVYSGYVTDDSVTFTMDGDNLQVSTKDASGNLQVGAWENITTAAQLSAIPTPIGFGGSALKEFFNLTQVGGCCTTQGLFLPELAAQFGFAFGYDPELAKALGSIANNNLIMAPGAFQLLEYTQASWLDGTPYFGRGGYSAFSTSTPAGVGVDVYITDQCPGDIGIKVIANTKLVALPDDMFSTDPTFDGVNGTAGVVVSNPAE